jgi:choline transport protein
MTYLMYCGFLILPLITGVLAGSKHAPALQFFAAAFNVGGLAVWAIVFLVMAPKTDAKFVFTEFVNTSGWSNDAWVFILSFYTPIYGLYGTDGVMHCESAGPGCGVQPHYSHYMWSTNLSLLVVSEEMKNPSRDAPRVMIWSMIWASLTAILSGAIMCYTVGWDWEARLEGGSPYLLWFMDVTSSVYGGGVFCCVLMMGLNVRPCLGRRSPAFQSV